MSSEAAEIVRLEHTHATQALKIWSLFNSAHQLEASQFSPLSRTIQNIQESTSEFWGLVVAQSLCAVLEFVNHGNWVEVHSLAVTPDQMRLGHGRALLTFLLGHFPDRIIEVETALENLAAMGLYQKAGFKVISQYETTDKVIKVLFRKTPR